MTNTSSTILGIAPGAKQIGISVFRDDDLLFYAIKSIKKPKREESLSALRKIIRDFLIKYQAEAVALKKVVFVQQHRTFIKTVHDEVKDFLKKRNQTVFEYNPRLVRAVICGREKPTRHNMSMILTQQYPELARYFDLPQCWQRRYYTLLFDAVSVGLGCATELKESRHLSAKHAVGV